MIYITKPIINQIYKKIKKYNTIVIARHISPDPDAIASQIALRDSIRESFPGKKVLAVGIGVAKFKAYGTLDKQDYENIKDALLIVLDVPNMARVDGIDNLKYKEILRIDHHPTMDIQANIDWCDIDCSSTCQMVSELIMDTKLVLNKKIANNLFLGLVSDSDRFLLKNTTAHTFEITARLIRESEIDFPSLYDILYIRPLNEIKFMAYIINNLIVEDNAFAYIKITEDVLKEYSVDTATVTNMINSFNFVEDYYVWCFIVNDKRNDIIKVSIRSRGPVINEIANKYNGGGHKLASGCRIKEEEDVNKLLEELKEAAIKYKESKEA
ncbi:MAG: bifunctional oligoribonuclease/PAP phosphatase NrnA [Bacilli bacterium]|nr:bifunctional oligoribonuclease/PAP phosphatase NrnA [Bacilli bacterium]